MECFRNIIEDRNDYEDINSEAAGNEHGDAGGETSETSGCYKSQFE